MKLNSYLKQFKNIAWYPSAFQDALSMVCLSFQSLKDSGIPKEEVPDCFIFTDYESNASQEESNKFFLDLDKDTNEVSFMHMCTDFTAIAYNVRELDRLKLPFDDELVAFHNDSYYGRVFTADVFIEHPEVGRVITKLVYVIAENTSFAFNFLLKHKVSVKYAIHSNYGYGFGGGVSTGAFMRHILKDLKTKYFVSDIDSQYEGDIADRYLSDEQRNTIPVLKRMDNFTYGYGWHGYNDTILYEVMGFTTPSYNQRYKIY